MNDSFSHTDLQNLIEHRGDNTVSIYMPANRNSTEIQKDSLRLKNLVTQAQDELMSNGMRRPDAVKLLKPATDRLDDTDFWQNQSHGLALLLAPDVAPQILRLAVRVDEMCHISHRYYVKPLIRLLSKVGRYFVLALSRQDVRFFDGNQDGLTQVTVNNLAATIEEALGEWEAERGIQHHTGTGKSGSDGRQAAMFHGHAGSDVQVKDELLRFFRHIDGALHPFLREERAPLVLAAVDYLHPIYADVCRYPHLLDDGYTGNPDELSEQELHAATWQLVAPIFRRELEDDRATFAQFAGTGRTASHVDEIATAAFQGRVDVAFVARGARVWGRFDATTGKVVSPSASNGDSAHDNDANNPDAASEDLLDFIALHTHLNGGKVHVPEAEEMPGDDVAAAVYRF